MKALILCSTILFLISHLCFGQSRGVWFWGSTTLPGGSASPYGSSTVVGNATAEDETVTFLSTHGVDRVYGSYQNRPVSEAAVIAEWNAKLDAQGISSQVLIDGLAVNDTVWRAGLLVKITNRLINFNSAPGRLAAEKFDALHLDLEPQGLAAWDGGTPAVKRVLLENLLETYQEVRAHLDGNGFVGFPVYADLPFFFDKLPADGGSVGWTNAADRDGWFAAIGMELDGISMMTFSKSTFASIDPAVDYERTALPGLARLGLQPKVGPGFLWPNIAAFNSVMAVCEANYGPTGATDIENYAFWRHAIATTGVLPPITGVIAVKHNPEVDDGGILVIHGTAGNIYIVKYSETLDGDWKEMKRYEAARDEDFKMPFSTQKEAGFFRVEITEQR